MNEHIKNVICLTDNYPDGQKICGAAICYDRPIDGAKLSEAAFAVDGRQIRGVRAEGETVVLDLDVRDRDAAIIPEPPPFKGKSGDKPPKGPPPDLPETVRRPREVTVRQVRDIYACDGSVIPGDGGEMRSTMAKEPIIEEFTQREFKGLKYNLYEPKERIEGATYPMVVFLHDAGPCGDDAKLTLSQGNGAVTWAAPEWQREHPCYVLAPQIPRSVKLTANNFTASEEIYTLKALIDDVANHSTVDQSRIYATGQSMGCMAFCELNILYPDYFAASMLVAGQWSPERMAEKCAQSKMWILVSEHDERAFPGMNAVTEALENAGARVGRYVWNAKSTPAQFDALTATALEDDVNIRYTVFEGSSVVPEDRDDNPATNHVWTWPAAYGIGGVKRWLFSCRK